MIKLNNMSSKKEADKLNSRTRKQVPTKDKWDLEAIYSSPKLWEEHLKVLKTDFPEIKNWEEKLNDADSVYCCLDLYFNLLRKIDLLKIYSSLKQTENFGDKKSTERASKMDDFNSSFSVTTAFIETELVSKDPDFLEELMKEERFDRFIPFLKDIIRRKQFFLSLREEKLLSAFQDILCSHEELFNIFDSNDLTFPNVKRGDEIFSITHGSYGELIRNSDREIRKQTMEGFNGSYRQFRATLAKNLSNHIKSRCIEARMRKYPHVLDLFLHDKEIPHSIYKSLFQATRDHLPLLHKYCDIRKRKLRLDELHWYDLYVPITNEVSKKYSYDEAVDLTLKSVNPLGQEYVDTLKQGLTTQKWVDKYENKGKKSGAFSWGCYDSYPYILLNYNGTLDSVSTLAHETGHSIHSHLSKNTQPYGKSDYVTFIAEIASTFNEWLLNEFMMKLPDDDTRIFMVNRTLENIRLTLFRQTMFAEFEVFLYDHVWNGGSLTPDLMEETYYKLNTDYYGPEVVIDDIVSSEWSRVPHFFYNFYVYQYATSLACSSYFSDKVLSDSSNKERDNYLELLKSGGSDTPINLLKNAGLDVTDPGYIDSLMKRFKILLDKFEELTN